MSFALKAGSPAAAVERPIRVMVVDDAIVARRLLTRWIGAEPDMMVSGSARTGREALDQVEDSNPDVVVLDVDMPELDGISALPLLLKKKPDLVVIMASTLTRRSAEISLRALSFGAADYIPKPESAPDAATSAAFRRELIEKIRNLGRHGRIRSGRARLEAVITAPAPRQRHPASSFHGQTSPIVLRPVGRTLPQVLLIGSSTGGPQALSVLMKDMDDVLSRAPVLITQHMPPTFTTVMAEHLARVSGRQVQEAAHGEPVVAGRVYVAPGGRHMRVVRDPFGAGDSAGRRSADQFLQARGRSPARVGGGSLGRSESRARSHRHGLGRHLGRRHDRRGGRQRDRAGRSHQRCLGHAALGRPGRPLFGGTAARPDRSQSQSSVRGDRR